MKAKAHKTVCLNRRARFDYEVIEAVEAGISLLGTEAKALREGRGNLTDAYVSLERGRPVVLGLEIAPYSQDATRERDPRRTRLLLLKAAEIRKLAGRIQEAYGITKEASQRQIDQWLSDQKEQQSEDEKGEQVHNRKEVPRA